MVSGSSERQGQAPDSEVVSMSPEVRAGRAVPSRAEVDLNPAGVRGLTSTR